jgi:hypothetical protein
MATVTDQTVVHFPEDYDEQSTAETPLRGYLSDVVVQVPGGGRYRVFFIDPVRLQQELADRVRAGQSFFAEVNLIVLPEVTTETIQHAAVELVRQGYFQQLKPLP